MKSAPSSILTSLLLALYDGKGSFYVKLIEKISKIPKATVVNTIKACT